MHARFKQDTQRNNWNSEETGTIKKKTKLQSPRSSEIFLPNMHGDVI
jgi:hypothetical protein